MSDTRLRNAVKVVDPTTDANQAAVDASGNLTVKVNTAIAAGTNNIGDVDVLTMPGTAVEDVAAAGGETGVMILAVRNDAAASKTNTDGDFSALATDAAGRVGIADLGGSISIDDNAGSITVDGTVGVSGAVDTELTTADLDTGAGTDTRAVIGLVYGASGGGTLVSTTNPLPVGDNGGSLTVDGTVAVSGSVDTELPAAGALADATANPTVPAVGSFAHGFNGTTWDRLKTANTGRLQVDVITGGGTDSPGTPITDLANSTNTAAGASSNIDSTDLGGNTRMLWQVDVVSSVPVKAAIHAYENGASVKQYTTVMIQPLTAYSWKPPHRAFATRAFAANAGFDGWRVVATNLDNTSAADIYAAFHYSTT